MSYVLGTYARSIKENFKTRPISDYGINKKFAEGLCLHYSKKFFSPTCPDLFIYLYFALIFFADI